MGSALVLFPFLALHNFNFPSADDFSYTIDSIEKGFYKSQIFFLHELVWKICSDRPFVHQPSCLAPSGPLRSLLPL